MNKKQILLIGVGDLGSKVLNLLNDEGYDCLAIHANYDLEKQIHCPQINLMDKHWRENEYPGFLENSSNMELLIEENKEHILKTIKDYFTTE